MNVRKLIEELQKMPPEAEVVQVWDGRARTVVHCVYLAVSGEVVTADGGMVVYDDLDRPVGGPTKDQDKYWETPSDPDED